MKERERNDQQFVMLKAAALALPLLLLFAMRPADPSATLRIGDFLEDLQTRYDQYMSKYQPVRINLIFNQPEYAPGDTAYFSAWYLNEGFQKVKGGVSGGGADGI